MHDIEAVALADANPNMSDLDRLVNLYWGLSTVLAYGVPGAVVELGCNEGLTSIWFQKIIDHFRPDTAFHVFDSFKGLPAPGVHDAYLVEGECATTRERLVANFERAGLRLPRIHEGWFDETLPVGCPEQVAFAYLDGDFYDSIMVSLEVVYPRLAPGALVMIDDYCDNDVNPRAWPGLPGVKKACDEFFADRPESVSVLVGTGDLTMGYFRKVAS
ncbi:MAG TPA: TylF/MycF/NovP-related O-methyltransferase [Mycobacteriales bacterium]|jgi:O-methyltransferase|nr:TylF/MycF/NovP-related O-methyltransferase [Mycobacteriales bacterium]